MTTKQMIKKYLRQILRRPTWKLGYDDTLENLSRSGWDFQRMSRS